MTKEEGEYFYGIAKNIPEDGKIMEIGSWKGRSTICFGLGVRDGNGAKIFAIDPHTGNSEHIKRFGKVNTYSEFIGNIKKAKVEKFIVPLKSTSEDADKRFRGEVDFIFVDGAHEYEFVKKDFELWFPKLKNGKYIAFHDCWHQFGVQLFTSQILLTSNKVCRPKLLDTLTIVQKVERNTFAERIVNILFVFHRLLFGWIGTIKTIFLER